MYTCEADLSARPREFQLVHSFFSLAWNHGRMDNRHNFERRKSVAQSRTQKKHIEERVELWNQGNRTSAEPDQNPHLANGKAPCVQLQT